MKIIDYMQRYDYEQLVFCNDNEVGLKAIIAIHDTTLGPALGGLRMYPYKSEEAAVLDVLRLGRAMTYKASAAGLNLGGGKAVIIGDPAKDKTAGLFHSLGRFVESFNGRYITTEDIGTTEQDMLHIGSETRHVTGLPLAMGSSGDPSPMTGYGVYRGMQACARAVFGSDSLAGRTVAVQGFGKVGSYLADYLREEGVNLVVADVNKSAARRARDEYGARLVSPDEIYDVECDIFAPCALGAVLNKKTIPRLRCPIVAGGANNQLEEEEDGDRLRQRGILHAPDYVINAGGIINLSLELLPAGYKPEMAKAQVSGIYQRLEKIIATARSEQSTTDRIADRLAQERIDQAKRVRRMYLNG